MKWICNNFFLDKLKILSISSSPVKKKCRAHLQCIRLKFVKIINFRNAKKNHKIIIKGRFWNKKKSVRANHDVLDTRCNLANMRIYCCRIVQCTSWWSIALVDERHAGHTDLLSGRAAIDHLNISVIPQLLQLYLLPFSWSSIYIHIYLSQCVRFNFTDYKIYSYIHVHVYVYINLHIYLNINYLLLHHPFPSVKLKKYRWNFKFNNNKKNLFVQMQLFKFTNTLIIFYYRNWITVK